MLTRRALPATTTAARSLGNLRAEAATPEDVLVLGKTIDNMIAMDSRPGLRVLGQRVRRQHMHAQAWCANPDDTGDSNLKIRAWRRHFADQQITDYVDRATKELDGKKQVAIYVNLQRQIWVHGPLVTPIAALHGM